MVSKIRAWMAPNTPYLRLRTYTPDYCWLFCVVDHGLLTMVDKWLKQSDTRLEYDFPSRLSCTRTNQNSKTIIRPLSMQRDT